MARLTAKDVDLSGLTDRQKKDVQKYIDKGDFKTAIQRATNLRSRSTVSTEPPVQNVVPQTPVPETQPLDTPQQTINLDTALREDAFNKNINVNQPNQITDTGQRTITQDPATGRTVVSDVSTGQNKALLEAGQGLQQQGFSLAQNALQGVTPFDLNQIQSPRFAIEGYDSERRRLEDAAYNALTRDLDKLQEREKQQTEQTLYNRGIPLGSTAYQNVMNDLGKRYDDLRQNARYQATQLGGEEVSRAAGIVGGLRASEIGEKQGATTFNLGLGQGLSNIGYGYQTPQFMNYNAVQYNPADVSGTALGFGQLDQGQQQIGLANKTLQETIRSNKAQEALERQRNAIAGRQPQQQTQGPTYVGGVPANTVF